MLLTPMNWSAQPGRPRPPHRDDFVSRVEPFAVRVKQFWNRVTEGRKIDQLWSQFQADARASYQLYSQEVDATRAQGVSRGKHFLGLVGQFFWAVLEKLTPARRVLLLIALVLIILPGGEWTWQTGSGEVKAFALDFHFYGGLLMFGLLVLEVADRVVMKRDLQIAKEIQAWLLPTKPPAIPGLDIAFATRPANTVAGDYYDVFARRAPDSSNQTFLFAVADVAGKSVPAALLMATFQASLKTLSSTPSTLSELAVRMNQYASSNSQNGRRFITAFLGEFDPASSMLTYVNAGHNPPILRRSSGTIERLQMGGVPLGIFDGGTYDSATVSLASGDWLVIFTDGVVEAENQRATEYGETRLLTVLNSGVNLSAVQLLGSLMADLDGFVGNAPQHDDVTCMLLRVL